MSVDAEIIIHIENSQTEEDIKEKLISDFNDAKNILDYYKIKDPEIYKKMLQEYQELRNITKKHTDSLNQITKNELLNIKSELNDIYEIEGYFDKSSRKVSTYLDDKIRTKREIRKEVRENYNEAKEYTESLPDSDYKQALLEELEKQKNQFDDKYLEHRTKIWNKKYSQELEQEASDIQILNDVRGIATALWEGKQYYDKAIELLNKPGNTDLIQAENILDKMNLIYLAAKANNVLFTGEFEEKRNEISAKIAENKKEIYDKNEEENIIEKSKFLGYISINVNSIDNEILSGNYKNIDPVKLFYYIRNKIGGDFSINNDNAGVSLLLKTYNRDFIKHLSETLAVEGSTFSAMIKEEGGKDFLVDLKKIEHIFKLNNIQDLNKATNKLDKTSEELKNGKDLLLNNPVIRQNFLETISKDPDNLNQYLQELKNFAIREEIKNLSPKLKNDLLDNQNNLTESEKNEILLKYEDYIIKGIEQGLKGDDLVRYLLQNGYSSTVAKSLISITDSSFKKSNDFISDTMNNLPENENGKLKKGLEKEILSTETFKDTAEKIALLNDENIEIFRDKLTQGETFDEIDKYFMENNSEYKELLEKQAIKNSIIERDFREKESPIYQDYTIDNNGEGSFINSENGENIQITEEEAKIVEDNPEGLKNLIDMKDKLGELNLGFMWTFREQLISLSEEILGTNGIDKGDKNFIDKNELNKLLNMVLNIAGYSGNKGSISGTYAKVILLNGVGSLNNKKDTNTGLSNIGMIFKSDKVGFLNNKDSLQTNWKSNVLNNYKQKKEA